MNKSKIIKTEIWRNDHGDELIIEIDINKEAWIKGHFSTMQYPGYTNAKKAREWAKKMQLKER